MSRSQSLQCLLLVFAVVVAPQNAFAAIIGAGQFSGTLERFDPITGEQTTFATLGSPAVGLAGIAYDQPANRLYVSARGTGQVFTLNATTGEILATTDLPGDNLPLGIAVSRSGQIAIAYQGVNQVALFDRSLNQTGVIDLPTAAGQDYLPAGVAYDNDDNLLISPLATPVTGQPNLLGIERFSQSGESLGTLAVYNGAAGQIAVDSVDNVYIGNVDVFQGNAFFEVFPNSVLKFDADGNEIGDPFLTIDDVLLPQPDDDYVSTDSTNPAGVLIDPDGNLIVAALGRTNPFDPGDNGQINGGLFKFDPDGNLIESFGTNITPMSAIVFVTAIPEPSSFVGLLLAGGVAIGRRRTQRPRV